ncbi:MAG: DUF4430 domain-containing protein [Ruminococcaceae bacterium]|nr:DUF4430 domain-containing protein [Oscillospiraceae bacterium]
MKSIKILTVFVAVIMLLMTMTSCLGGGTNDVKVSCTISVVAGDVFILDEYPYEAVGQDGAAPTILNAVEGLLLYNDIAYVVDGGRFDSISDVEGTVYEQGANNYFWLCTINGEEMKGRADNVVVNEGDVIVYEYTLVEPE